MLRPTTVSSFLAAFVIGGLTLAAHEAPHAEPAAAAADPAQPVAVVGVSAVEPAAAARITGTVKFKGTPPADSMVDMSVDPTCSGLHPDGLHSNHVDVDAQGGLADVFIQLTDVPDAKHDTPDEPVVLDQRGCVYVPLVFGVMKKQPIKILNSDDTLHNVHAVPKDNKEFNTAMPTKGMSIEREFKKAEESILIKCDVHPWMATYCFSMEHPYFATTGADGSFTLAAEDLPDGEYGFKVWHRVFGEATGKVKVAGGAGTIEHTFERK